MAGKVAVIGGGSTGITACKALAEAGFQDIVCFERRDVLGGLWYFSEKPATWTDESSVNRTTVINTSKEFMAFSDYPMPNDYPNFCHNKMVEKYFLDYAHHFDLEKYVRFNTEVISVKKHSSFQSTGRWEITSRDHVTSQDLTETFDFVLIATGHHGEPNLPSVPGLDTFQGETMHSKDFKDALSCADKRACVVGIGNSGGDISAELSKYCEVFLSTRRGVWILHRLADTGLPWDYNFHIRFSWWAFNMVPRKLSNYGWKRNLSNKIDHELFGLKSLSEPDSTHPTVNDELPNRIACGMIKVKPNISRFTKTGIEFEDGTFEDNIDLVVFATGYKVGYPFLDKSIVGEIKGNRLELYKHMWPINLPHPTLAFLGAVQPLGSMFPIAELQARLAARVFKGEVSLPSPDKMKRDFQRHDAAIKRRYVDTPRHTFQVDWLPYMDELATMTGCKPNLAWIFMTDPVLFWNLVFGPGTPYQYRLQGPNAWSGARHAQLTVLDRIRKPFATRPLPKSDHRGIMSTIQTVGVVALVTCALGYGVHYVKVKGIDIWDLDVLHNLGIRT